MGTLINLFLKNAMINDFNMPAVTFYQYDVADRSDDQIYAVLTIQDNTLIDFIRDSPACDQDHTSDDPFEYIWDLRVYEPEFYGEIARAIASEMIDITCIKFVYRQSFQVPFSMENSKGSINDLYGKVFDDDRISYLFSLTCPD